MNTIDWSAATVVGLFLGLTALRQVNAISRAVPVFSFLVAWDTARLLPLYTFFAPNPGCMDYHIVFRDLLSESTMTPWTEVSIVQTRRWWHMLWNPRKRRSKIIMDAVSGLTRSLSASKEPIPVTRVQTTLPYLILLNEVAQVERNYAAVGTQFAVIAIEGGADAERLVLRSAFHAL